VITIGIHGDTNMIPTEHLTIIKSAKYQSTV